MIIRARKEVHVRTECSHCYGSKVMQEWTDNPGEPCDSCNATGYEEDWVSIADLFGDLR